MKLASFCIASRTSWGVVDGGYILDVGRELQSRYSDLRALIEAGAQDEVREHSRAAPHVAIKDIQWLPVIANPNKILCVGLNYENHRKEIGRAAVDQPTIFARYANSQTGHLSNIQRPRVSTSLDYEGELAVIIGRPGRYIAQAQAWDHIAGYACYNDGTLRDWQRHTSQFTPGKNFPQTGAFGPWMVTREDRGEIGPQRIQTRLNGTVVQTATLGDMIFSIPKLIEYCSSFTRLEPGDVIATGTPGGVGDKRNPQLWMKPGDLVEVEIDGVGILRNGVADEEAD
jgi:2-keto-4-pentenoate hydratase/2-oxohepta-3-ene-1,7-dioic acid hydratase in catechol pathway